MDRRILEYLPGVLRALPEFSALMQAEQPEVEALWAEQIRVLENQFLVTADELGVRRWERILKIYSKDTDELETRRARVLSVLRLKLPYTVRGLRRWLHEMCGGENYGLEVGAYKIGVELNFDDIPGADSLFADILAALCDMRPANMHLELGGNRRSAGAVKTAGITQSVAVLDVWPERLRRHASGGVKLWGYTEYTSVVSAHPKVEGELCYA